MDSSLVKRRSTSPSASLRRRRTRATTGRVGKPSTPLVRRTNSTPVLRPIRARSVTQPLHSIQSLHPLHSLHPLQSSIRCNRYIRYIRHVQTHSVTCQVPTAFRADFPGFFRCDGDSDANQTDCVAAGCIWSGGVCSCRSAAACGALNGATSQQFACGDTRASGLSTTNVTLYTAPCSVVSDPDYVIAGLGGVSLSASVWLAFYACSCCADLTPRCAT